MKTKTLSYINPLYLVGLFLICPILLFITIIDMTILNGAVLKALPSHPEQWAFWLVLFGLPHIIASFITMADKENLSKYGSKILKVILVLTGASLIINGVIPSSLEGNDLYEYQILMFSIYGFATVYHVVTQQLGIGLVLNEVSPSPEYKIFKWFSITLSFILLLLVLLNNHIPTSSTHLVKYTFYLCTALLLACIYFGWKFSLMAKSKIGKVYVYLNIFMFLSMYIFAIFDYAIFAIIIPRFIHDITAFIFYSNHDANKFKYQGSNYFYRVFHKLPIPVSIISPLLGVIIAYSFNSSIAWVLLYAKFVLEFFHYYIESFMWKSGGSHRLYLKIKLSP